MKCFKMSIYMIFIFIFMCMFSFNSFAITSYDSLDQQSFEDGPWAGYPVRMGRINRDGSVQNVGVENWRSGSSLGDAYYGLFGDTDYDYDCYINSVSGVSNIVIGSYDPLLELYTTDYNSNIIANVLDDAFLVKYGDVYLYGISCIDGTGIAFRSHSFFLVSEYSPALNGGNYYEAIESALPFVGGVYDGNSVAVKYPGMHYVDSIMPRTVSYGFSELRFPVSCVRGHDDGVTSLWKFNTNNGVLHSGSRYTFIFEIYNITNGLIYLGDVGNANSFSPAASSLTMAIDGIDGTLSDLGFGFTRSFSDVLSSITFVYKSSFSDDIGTLPPSDSGGDSGSPDYSSALSQIGSRLEGVMAAVSGGAEQVVNNITYQTTQITNTITNTVMNMTQQISQGLTDVKQGITDKLQGVQEGISSSIDEANKAQIDSDQKLHEEQIKADKENTDQITGGFDNSQQTQQNQQLQDSINAYDEVEEDIFEDVDGFMQEFEYPSFDSMNGSVIKALAFIGGFLQSIFLSMGDFGTIITFSLTMIFVMIIVGYHRIRS